MFINNVHGCLPTITIYREVDPVGFWSIQICISSLKWKTKKECYHI